MSQTSGKKLLLLGGLGLILGLHLVHLRHYYFLTDDAFISFRYLQNWIEGRGLVFNPGERVEGYTNFLWIVLLAPFALLHLPPEAAAPILSSVCSMILLVLVFLFPRLSRQENQMRPGWLLAPLLLALNRSYAVWATSGLEARCFTLLIFLGAIFAWRASQNLSRRDPLWAGVFFALAELCRPEATLFCGTAVILVLGLRALEGKAFWRRTDGVGLLIFLGELALHYLGRRWYYGMWLPNTFYAKVNEPWWDMGLQYLSMFILEYSWWGWLPPLLAYGLLAFRRRRGITVWLALFPLFYLVYLARLGGDHFEYRFFDLTLPFLALLFQDSIRLLGQAGLRPRLRRILFAAYALVFLLYSTALPWATGLGFGTVYARAEIPPVDLAQAPGLKFLPGLAGLAGAWKNGYAAMAPSFVGIRAEELRLFGRQQMDGGQLFQDFIRRGFIAPEEMILTNAVGALPYYSRLPTLDFFGLTDPVIARAKPVSWTRSMFHEKSPLLDYIQQRNVDYILLGNFLTVYRGPASLIRYRPASPLHLEYWSARTYLVRLDSWLLKFQSPQPPVLLNQRFQQRNLPIYLYVPQDGEAVPVLLSEVLPQRLELWQVPSRF